MIFFSIYNEKKEFNLKKSQHGIIMIEPLFPVIESFPIEIEMDGFYKLIFLIFHYLMKMTLK